MIHRLRLENAIIELRHVCFAQKNRSRFTGGLRVVITRIRSNKFKPVTARWSSYFCATAHPEITNGNVIQHRSTGTKDNHSLNSQRHGRRFSWLSARKTFSRSSYRRNVTAFNRARSRKRTINSYFSSADDRHTSITRNDVNSRCRHVSQITRSVIDSLKTN